MRVIIIVYKSKPSFAVPSILYKRRRPSTFILYNSITSYISLYTGNPEKGRILQSSASVRQTCYLTISPQFPHTNYLLYVPAYLHGPVVKLLSVYIFFFLPSNIINHRVQRYFGSYKFRASVVEVSKSLCCTN